jgi:hypothetical protein
MTGPLRDEVNARLPWLAQNFGFRITNHDYSYKHMGDSFVDLRSDSVHLRFVRDRSSIGLRLASPKEPERWFEAGFLWFALTGVRPDPELEGWAWFFREHAESFAEALGPRFEETKGLYNVREKESVETLKRHLPPRTLVARLLRLRSTPLVGSLLMGPIGWVVAIALLVWLAVR